MGVRKRPEKFNDDYLEDGRAAEHTHKYIVVEYAFEHVYFLHFSWAYLVENLHWRLRLSLPLIEKIQIFEWL